MTSITTGGKATTYAYDADGIRTEKVINGVTHHYVTRGGKLMRESFLSGSAEIIMDFSYDESGRPFAVSYSKDGGASFTTYYYATNLQGDVVMIFGRAAIKDANGNVTGYTVKSYGYYTYDAWGNVTAYTSTGGTPATTSLICRNPLRYRGYIYDTETGFYYLQSRYYDPANHRFINADVYTSTDSTDAISCNMFAYCGNNPVIRFDPYGELFFTALGGIIGAGVGFFSSLAKGEDPIEGACNGFVSGAISGAGIDIAVSAVASGGASLAVGMTIAGTFGVISGVVDVGLSTNWTADPMEYVAGGLVGGIFNCISFGLAPINGEIVKGTFKETVNQIVTHGMLNLAENVITGTMTSCVFTLIVDKIKREIQ